MSWGRGAGALGKHSPYCQGFASRSALAPPWSSAERGNRVETAPGTHHLCLWARVRPRCHGHPCGADLQVQAEALSPRGCHEQSRRHSCSLHRLHIQPWLRTWWEATTVCPILLAWLLLLRGSPAQGNVHGSKSSLPGDTAAPCPRLQARPATHAASPCQPRSWGGVAAPQCLPLRCRRSTVSRRCAPCSRWESPSEHPAQPDLGTAVLQDKVHPAKRKPSPVAASPVVSSPPLAGLALPPLCRGALPGTS